MSDEQAPNEQSGDATPTGPVEVSHTQELPPPPSSWFTQSAGSHGAPPRADTAWGNASLDAAELAAARAAAEREALRGNGPGHRAADAPGSEPGPSALPGVPAGPSGPAGPGVAAPANRRTPTRGALVAGAAVLALLAGSAGSAVTLLATNRTGGTAAGSGIPTPGPGATERPSGSVAAIAATALPSVVTIEVRGSAGSGIGSGFVIDKQGHILTNNHVVRSAAESGQITVSLLNGTQEKATIVGRDESYDLAVIKVDRSDLPVLEFARSADVVVGDPVIAMGAPLGLDSTVTTGIVSALNRPVTPGTDDERSFINAIQTDAAINPGNSGGPLLDMVGKVIGVNSAIARAPGTTGDAAGNIGVGFAIPSDVARRTAEQLIATGKAQHPVIGVKLNRTYDGQGVQVASGDDAVTPGGPAALAGIKPGDVILEFDGRVVRSADALVVAIRAKAVGDSATLKIRRGSDESTVTMTLQADSSS